MLQFLLDGGPLMILVVILGLLSVASGIVYARSGSASSFTVLKTLSISTLTGSGCAFCVDLRKVLTVVATASEFADSPQRYTIVMVGVAESLTPCIVGLALLSGAWCLAAVGSRRAAVGN